MRKYNTAKISDRTILECDEDSRIGDFTFIGCAKLIMAEKAVINRFCEIQGRGTVRMGFGSQIASHASIITSTDTPWGSMSDAVDEEERRVRTGDVTIGDHAFVGSYVTIMPGVTIGNCAVIGAYSYIATDVPAKTIVHPRVSLMQMRRKIDPKLSSFFGNEGTSRWSVEEEITEDFYDKKMDME